MSREVRREWSCPSCRRWVVEFAAEDVRPPTCPDCDKVMVDTSPRRREE